MIGINDVYSFRYYITSTEYITRMICMHYNAVLNKKHDFLNNYMKIINPFIFCNFFREIKM